jgi:hypothetical protein
MNGAEVAPAGGCGDVDVEHAVAGERADRAAVCGYGEESVPDCPGHGQAIALDADDVHGDEMPSATTMREPPSLPTLPG